MSAHLERTQAAPVVWSRALRLHQWAKNALLLVPALAAHLSPAPAVVLDLGRAFLSFSLLSSALYLLNDALDQRHDRLHPVKRDRPLASGRISVQQAAAVGLALAAGALLLALQLPRAFLASCAAYVVLSASYSLALKRVVVLDVMVLATLYTLRVVAGAAAVEVPLSRWFLAFSVFLFLSLAVLKRLVEIQGAEQREATRIEGRAWSLSDGPLLLAFGAGSASSAALVYCLYITSAEVLTLYARPDLLWLGLPLFLYWLMRTWLLALRGEVHEDPLIFALRDGPSYVVLVVFAALVWLAS